MTNPIKEVYKRWRTRRESRKDARLRQLCLASAIRENNPFTFETLYRAHTYYLYLKNGVSEDGVTVQEIFQKTKEEVNQTNRPIKL